MLLTQHGFLRLKLFSISSKGPPSILQFSRAASCLLYLFFLLTLSLGLLVSGFSWSALFAAWLALVLVLLCFWPGVTGSVFSCSFLPAPSVSLKTEALLDLDSRPLAGFYSFCSRSLWACACWSLAPTGPSMRHIQSWRWLTTRLAWSFTRGLSSINSTSGAQSHHPETLDRLRVEILGSFFPIYLSPFLKYNIQSLTLLMLERNKKLEKKPPGAPRKPRSPPGASWQTCTAPW